MSLLRSTCLRTRYSIRCLSTATAYQPHTIPTHNSPAREAFPKIPNYPNPSTPSTATPASSITPPAQSPPTVTPTTPSTTSKRVRRPRKQVLTLTSQAIARLQDIQSSEGKMIKISVVAKGCAGGAYKLEYVDQAERFDEVVEQDDVKVLVDSKSLMKIIGSVMDYSDDVLASRFTFRNPNVVSTCGCEESFATKEDEERLLASGGRTSRF